MHNRKSELNFKKKKEKRKKGKKWQRNSYDAVNILSNFDKTNLTMKVKILEDSDGCFIRQTGFIQRKQFVANKVTFIVPHYESKRIGCTSGNLKLRISQTFESKIDVRPVDCFFVEAGCHANHIETVARDAVVGVIHEALSRVDVNVVVNQKFEHVRIDHLSLWYCGIKHNWRLLH